LICLAKTAFRSVNEYIASKPKDVRGILERVRGAIRTAVPAAEEAIAYQMPVYTLDGVPVLYFAGWKHHYSLYPASDVLVAAFRDELARYSIFSRYTFNPETRLAQSPSAAAWPGRCRMDSWRRRAHCKCQAPPWRSVNARLLAPSPRTHR
jgi:uncharacterized protein YdhG (YjbR/CyaY superfamily)